MNGISVIVPVYNVEQYVEECIVSIVSELRNEDELILINDGSKDNSLEVCNKYKSENVHIVNNSNHGVSYSRNCGIQKSACDYIMFVDSDDYLFSGWRKSVESAVCTEKDIVYFSQNSFEIPSKSDIVKDVLCLPSIEELSIKASACWYKVFRTDFIKENGIFFDSEIINGEDGLFCLEAITNAESYTVINVDDFYYYRTNNNSATHSFNEKFNISNIKYIKTVNEVLKNSDLFEASEIKTWVDFISVHGLFVLAYRISCIKNSTDRKSKYHLFAQPEYIELYNTYSRDEYCSKRIWIIFNLLKRKYYNIAIMAMKLYKSMIYIKKKVMRK